MIEITERERFVNKIERIRKEEKLTYKEIAKKLGITDRYLRYLRKGGRKISKNMKQKLDKLFEIIFPVNFVVYFYKESVYIFFSSFVCRTFQTAIKRVLIIQEVYKEKLIEIATFDDQIECFNFLKSRLKRYRVKNKGELISFMRKLLYGRYSVN